MSPLSRVISGTVDRMNTSKSRTDSFFRGSRNLTAADQRDEPRECDRLIGTIEAAYGEIVHLSQSGMCTLPSSQIAAARSEVAGLLARGKQVRADTDELRSVGVVVADKRALDELFHLADRATAVAATIRFASTDHTVS